MYVLHICGLYFGGGAFSDITIFVPNETRWQTTAALRPTFWPSVIDTGEGIAKKLWIAF